MPKLVIFRGDSVEQEVRLAGRAVRIGRDARNDIPLDDKSVSRFHAEVRPEGSTYFIVDLKSRNGVWVNGQQAKGKTALTLGAPVTLGAYELVLEDDVSTGEFDEESLVVEPRAATVAATSVTQSDRPSRSATRASMRAPTALTKRQIVLWSGVAVAVLLLIGITVAVARYRRSAAPTAVEVVNPPALPSSPTVAIAQPTPPPPQDPIKDTIDRHLADAQASFASGDFAAARDHLTKVLDLDKNNQTALDLRRKVDAAPKPKPPQVAVAPPPTTPAVAEVETPGIPRKPGEAWPVYSARVEATKLNFEQGKAYLAKQIYAQAIARFRAVAGDAPKYQGVDALFTEALAKQKAAFDEAMNGGDQNERAGKSRDARIWYQRAMEIDPNSTAARDKNIALLNKALPEATRLQNRASGAAKTGNPDQATRLYNQILELLLPGDEIRETAAKELENLKR